MRRSALRLGLYIFGAVLLVAAALLALFVRAAVGLQAAIPGLVLILALAVEHWRYKRVTSPRPGPGWEATGERFVDPETGKLVTVYFHPASGERRYVAGESAAASPTNLSPR